MAPSRSPLTPQPLTCRSFYASHFRMSTVQGRASECCPQQSLHLRRQLQPRSRTRRTARQRRQHAQGRHRRRAAARRPPQAPSRPSRQAAERPSRCKTQLRQPPPAPRRHQLRGRRRAARGRRRQKRWPCRPWSSCPGNRAPQPWGSSSSWRQRCHWTATKFRSPSIRRRWQPVSQVSRTQILHIHFGISACASVCACARSPRLKW